MFISLKWVREFCTFSTDEKPVEIGARFSLHTAEVESARLFGEHLEKIVVALVESVEPHPEADRLQVVRVNVGKKTVSVVCGAPNVAPGQLVPYAPPGSMVQGQEIKTQAVRGVRSEGMLCSQKELQVSDDGAGLWVLPDGVLSDGVQSGARILQSFPELLDIVIEVDNKSLTHRPDLWGHYGIAREFSAIYRHALAELAVDEELASRKGAAKIKVNFVGDGIGGRGGLCPRYCGLQIDGVKVAPSPAWLQHRLLAVNSRPINNIVDVTNYILFELGQPLHAFDTSLVAGGEIQVRRAAAGESLELLDDSTAQLLEEDLVIADAKAPVALAGIMGGAGTEITPSATSVFLECANFSPVRVRQTSRRVGKATDSSTRFEKSLDPVGTRAAILRAARMILDLCPGAQVIGRLQDVGYEPAETIEVDTSPRFLTNRLGVEIPPAAVRESLTQLGFGVAVTGDSVEEGAGEEDADWCVSVPSWRATKDISIEEDLVEEVGRIYGYDNIPPFAPEWPVATPRANPHRLFERRAKAYLTQHAGLSEVFTYAMVGKAHCERFGLDPEAHLKLQNPVSEELDRMRRELVPIHLEKVRDNQRYSDSFGFFELGRVFRKPMARLKESELPEERNRLAGVVACAEKAAANFYRVRDFVLGLLRHLGISEAEILPAADDGAPDSWVHPAVVGRLVVGGANRGLVCRVHPLIAKQLKLKGDVIAFDLAFDEILEEGPRAKTEYQPPSRYPTVPFDVAVLAGPRVPVRDIQTVIAGAAGEALLESAVMNVFDVVDERKKSVAFHLVFGSRDRTLTGDEVTALQTRVIGALEAAGYHLR